MSILDKIIFHWHYSRLNVFKTLLINFKTLPFKQAIKFPIYVYGKLDIYYLQGSIEFENCKIQKGIVKIGANKEFLNTVKGPSLLILLEASKIVFEGPCEISSNALIRTGKNAELRFGKNVFLGSNVKTVCINKILIGEGTRIGFESQLIDSDFHYTYDTQKREVRPREKAIMIGKYNWIGNRTTINKGTKTGDFTIVASSSILNRNYNDSDSTKPLLAGAPAKILDNRIRRIFSLDIESELIQFFKRNPNSEELPTELIDKIEKDLHS